MFRTAKFEVVTAVLVKILVLWNCTPSHMVNGLRRAKGSYFVHLQFDRKEKGTRTFSTSLSFDAA
jgi:hypothetical protein